MVNTAVARQRAPGGHGGETTLRPVSPAQPAQQSHHSPSFSIKPPACPHVVPPTAPSFSENVLPWAASYPPLPRSHAETSSQLLRPCSGHPFTTTHTFPRSLIGSWHWSLTLQGHQAVSLGSPFFPLPLFFLPLLSFSLLFPFSGLWHSSLEIGSAKLPREFCLLSAQSHLLGHPCCCLSSWGAQGPAVGLLPRDSVSHPKVASGSVLSTAALSSGPS